LVGSGREGCPKCSSVRTFLLASDPGIQRLQCGNCGECFLSVIKNGEVVSRAPLTVSPVVFPCLLCGKKCMSKSGRTWHIRRHHDQKVGFLIQKMARLKKEMKKVAGEIRRKRRSDA